MNPTPSDALAGEPRGDLPGRREAPALKRVLLLAVGMVSIVAGLGVLVLGVLLDATIPGPLPAAAAAPALLLVGLGAVALGSRMRREEPWTEAADVAAARDADEEEEAVVPGIRGWLLLPALQLVLKGLGGPFVLALMLFAYPDLDAEGDGDLFLLEFSVAFLLTGWALYAAWLFFRKRRAAPRAMIVLYAGWLVGNLLVLGLESSRTSAEEMDTQLRLVMRYVGAALIWIPYFRVSRRVKATFVR